MTRRVALLTGVGRPEGIGAGIAERLAADGWDVAFSHWASYDVRVHGAPDATAEVERRLQELGARVFRRNADLALPATASALVREAMEALGPISALVLCHTESVDSSILETTLESFEQHFAVNVRASWQLIAEFARQVPGTGGRIVALTSDHVVHNLPYGASKGALDRIVLAAARELGHLGITSNAVNPGPIDTAWMTDEIRDSALARQPTGRLGTPSDTADLVGFLLSERGTQVRGLLPHRRLHPRRRGSGTPPGDPVPDRADVALGRRGAAALVILVPYLPQIAEAFELWWLAVAAIIVIALSALAEYACLRRASLR